MKKMQSKKKFIKPMLKKVMMNFTYFNSKAERNKFLFDSGALFETHWAGPKHSVWSS